MHKIICPKCGAEYLPSEIYFAEDLIGKQKNIVKNDEGKILSYIEEEKQSLKQV